MSLPSFLPSFYPPFVWHSSSDSGGHFFDYHSLRRMRSRSSVRPSARESLSGIKWNETRRPSAPPPAARVEIPACLSLPLPPSLSYIATSPASDGDFDEAREGFLAAHLCHTHKPQGRRRRFYSALETLPCFPRDAARIFGVAALARCTTLAFLPLTLRNAERRYVS